MIFLTTAGKGGACPSVFHKAEQRLPTQLAVQLSVDAPAAFGTAPAAGRRTSPAAAGDTSIDTGRCDARCGAVQARGATARQGVRRDVLFEEPGGLHCKIEMDADRGLEADVLYA